MSNGTIVGALEVRVKITSQLTLISIDILLVQRRIYIVILINNARVMTSGG